MMPPRMHVALAVGLLLAHCSASAAATQRAKVHLLSGSISTSRDLDVGSDASSRPSSRGRLLSSNPGHDLWLLTLPPDEQHQVLFSLRQRAGVQLLHSLPGETHAWMLYAPADAIQHLIGQHDSVAAARMPSNLKVSPPLANLIKAITTQPSAQALDLTGLKGIRASLSPTDGFVYVDIVATTGGVSADHMSSVSQTVMQTVSSLTEGAKEVKVSILGTYLELRIPAQHLPAVVSWLTSHPEITWVDVARQTKLHDLYSAASMQAPRLFPNVSYPAPNVTTSQYRTFWQAGIDGTGQIVGVTDSGLDMKSCLLQDTNTTDGAGFKPQKFTLTGSGRYPNVSGTIFVNPTARKVLAYMDDEDDVDDSTSGHGTHVVTSIVGIPTGQNPNTTSYHAIGAAPMAKVAFWDAGRTNRTGGSNGSIWTSGPISQIYIYPLLKQLGASVTSNSWGSDRMYLYTSSECAAIDAHAYQNQDMLHVFSAGNEGLTPPNNTGTVSTPAACKNVMGVGAAESYVWGGVARVRLKGETAKDGPYLNPRGAQNLIFSALDTTGKPALPTVFLNDGTGLGCGLGVNARCEVGYAFSQLPSSMWKLDNYQAQVLSVKCPVTAASGLPTPNPPNRPVAVLLPVTCSDNDIDIIMNKLPVAGLLFYRPTPTTPSGPLGSLINASAPSPSPSPDPAHSEPSTDLHGGPAFCPKPNAGHWGLQQPRPVSTSTQDQTTQSVSGQRSQDSEVQTTSGNTQGDAKSVAGQGGEESGTPVDAGTQGVGDLSESDNTQDDFGLADLLPGVFILSAGMAKLQALLTQTQYRLYVTWAPPNASNPQPWENVADFSSVGSPLAFRSANGTDPTNQYYRIKPDVMAPGWVEAGTSDGLPSFNNGSRPSFVRGVCNITTRILAGTSMACPQVASAALMVRQYFMDGFYPTGARVAANAFTPSGTLIRAVITAGTTAMRGVAAVTGVPLAPPPSQYQGFGRVDLSNTLPLAGVNGKTLRVVQDSVRLGGRNFSLTVNATASDESLAVVLVWNDPPSFAGATVSWINNLDLLVTGPNGVRYFPNGRSSPDRVNNVEKVFIAPVPPGQYTITVSPAYLSVIGDMATQAFALAISGGSALPDTTPPLNPNPRPSPNPAPASPAPIIITPDPREPIVITASAPGAGTAGIANPGGGQQGGVDGTQASPSSGASCVGCGGTTWRAVVGAAVAASLLAMALI